MDKITKTKLRGNLFKHLDGIAITSTIATLHQEGIINYILSHEKFNFTDIISNFPSNHGYMNVALRLLASQGWLIRNSNIQGEIITFNLTKKGAEILKFSELYDKVSPCLNDLPLYRNRIFSKHISMADTFTNIVNQILEFGNYAPDQVNKHLQGIIVGPALVALGMNKKLDAYLEKGGFSKKDINEFPLIKSISNYFCQIGFLSDDNNYIITEIGEFYFKRATAYGVTVSYLPMYAHQSEILFGDPHFIWKRSHNGAETHVNRTMNVWGSGGAHSIYFKKIDEIVIDIFNQPLETQPIGIADMGCGDGTLLKHLFHLVKNNTLRGKHLKNHPLMIVGADFNQAARIASTNTLTEAHIKHHILHADISHPNKYAAELQSQFDIDLGNLLNVRSFLDHNRIYSPPKMVYSNRTSKSTGAYTYRGRLIPNYELKQNLVEHLRAWSPYVKQFGLLVLELHCLAPVLTANHLGKTTATAYESTHGYSDQFIVEISTFLNAAKEAGLVPQKDKSARFPDSDLATISINLFKFSSAV